MSRELVIQISGDVSDYQKALKRARAETEGLSDLGESITRKSAIAFAGFTAELVLASKAAGEAAGASKVLTQSLINQGIYSEQLVQTYKNYAQAVTEKTQYDDDDLVRALALGQAYLGRIEVTERMSKAIVDLAAAEGIDLASAAEKVTRTIGTNTNAFARQGLVLDESLTKHQRMAEVLEYVERRASDMAETNAKGEDVWKRVAKQIGEIQEQLGKNLTPATTAAGNAISALLDRIEKSDGLTSMAAGFIASGAAMTGTIAATASVATSIVALQNVLSALGVTLTLTRVALLSLTGAGVVAAVVAGLGLIGSAFLTAQERAESFKGNIPGATEKLAELRKELVQLRAEQDAAAAAYQRANSLYRPSEEERLQAATKRVQATRDEIAAIEALIAKEAEHNDLRNAQAEYENQQQEANDANKAKEKRAAEMQAELDDLTVQYDQEQFAKQEQLKTIQEIEADARLKERNERVKARNQFLEDERKFGTAYAAINQAMHSAIYVGSKTAFGELAALQQSSNSTLKAIGKAAAVANIVIKTAESAMNIYAGFSTIPIVGHALGIAGAAAAVAFGGEQLGRVTGARDGALVGGGQGVGGDRFPFMLERGELVTPDRNFEEVVGSTRAMREAEKLGGAFGSDPEAIALLRVIAQNMTSGGGGTQVTIERGPMTNDEVLRLLEQLDEAVRFGNARLTATGVLP